MSGRFHSVRRARLGLPADPVTVTLTPTGVAGTALRLITDQGVRMNVPLPESGTVAWTTTPRNSRYVRAEVRRGDAMVALTKPVFLGA